MPASRLLLPIIMATAMVRIDAADSTPSPFSGELKAEAIRTVCDAVAKWQMEHPGKNKPLDWTYGALYSGLFAWGEVAANQSCIDHLRTIGDKNGWKAGPRPGHADDHCVNQTWLQFYLHDRLPGQFEPTSATMGDFIAKDPGNLEWSSKPVNRDWAWCDALFMAPPTLALLSTATGDLKWLNRMDGRWWHTSDFLFDKEEHLYFRDSSFFKSREKNGKKVFWSRGNGWVFAGLVHVLQHMPSDFPSRSRYEEQFRQMAARLVEIQTPDGTWHASLLDPENWTVPETSGTAFYTYGLLWGVSTGLLTADKHLEPAIKAWKRLVTHVKASGKLGYVQPIGAAPASVGPDSTDVYGIGGFLLAGTEMLNRVTLDGAKRAELTVTNPLETPRLREVASLSWVEAVKLLPGLTPANVAVRDCQTGQLVPVQTFDSTGDGTPDELLFLATLMPKQARRCELIQLAGPQLPQLLSRMSARHVPERKDDFAWESDRMAYRLYGPALAKEGSRGGHDVWCKRVREAVVDQWYKSGKYHNDAGQGCDCYKVGATLGCGALGYLDPQGKLVVSPVYASWKLLANGPLRVGFVLTYPAQAVGKATITETRRITMDLGENFFHVTSSFAVVGDATGIKPAPGFQSAASEIPAEAVATGWEATEQGEAKTGRIGLGLILTGNMKASVKDGHIIGTADDLTKPVSWSAGATWSRGADYTTPETWRNRATETAARFAAPVVVTAASR